MKRLILGLAAVALTAPAFAAGTLADVTVFDRAAGRVLPVYWSRGQAFVAGAGGDEEDGFHGWVERGKMRAET